MSDNLEGAISQRTIRLIGFGMGLGAVPVWYFGDAGMSVVVTGQLALMFLYLSRIVTGGKANVA